MILGAARAEQLISTYVSGASGCLITQATFEAKSP